MKTNYKVSLFDQSKEKAITERYKTVLTIVERQIEHIKSLDPFIDMFHRHELNGLVALEIEEFIKSVGERLVVLMSEADRTRQNEDEQQTPNSTHVREVVVTLLLEETLLKTQKSLIETFIKANQIEA